MRKILIVDDEKMMLLWTRRILSSKYEIVTAMTGTEAIEIFQREKPDLVLSDLMMPEMDGYEMHKILEEKNSAPVPIIFMTADESDESESKGFEVGAVDYIRKPLRPDVLLKRVGNAIDHLDKIHGLETAAATDPLTKLLNKSAAQKEIGELVQNSTGALIILDLDSFKLVNDIYGHSAGDKILANFADLIRKITRENDLIGRIGGDEFIAYLHNVDDEKILQAKTKFLNEQLLSTAKKILGADMSIPLGVSVGAVFVPDEGTEFITLYKAADSVLYDVKKQGKHSCAVYGKHHHVENHLTRTDGIYQTKMILGERNIEPGAYFVDFNIFQHIYRLLSRMCDNYRKGLTLIQFTVADENFAEKFKDTLLHSLRKSDCVSQSGKNKFLVLLMEATEEESLIVRDRIFSKLEKNLTDKISFECEKIF